MPTDSDSSSYNLEQAMAVKARLKRFASVMFLINICMTSALYYFALRAFNTWVDYRVSQRYTIQAFCVRVFTQILVSLFPWYAIFFAYDEGTRPLEMNRAARFYLDLLLNIPVINLAIMLLPAFNNLLNKSGPEKFIQI